MYHPIINSALQRALVVHITEPNMLVHSINATQSNRYNNACS